MTVFYQWRTSTFIICLHGLFSPFPPRPIFQSSTCPPTPFFMCECACVRVRNRERQKHRSLWLEAFGLDPQSFFFNPLQTQNYSLCYSSRSYFSFRFCRNTSLAHRTHNHSIYMQEKSQNMN